MRVEVCLLLCALPITTHAATVVKFGAKLCDAGQQMSGGTCVDIVRGTCPSGFYESTIYSNTFSAQTMRNSQCMNAYDKMTMPDVFYPIYSGVLVKFGPTLCDKNQQMSGGTCVDRVQGRCPDGFYKTVTNQNTFSSPSATLSECMNSYNQYDVPDDISMIYNGILVSFGPKLCGAGQYLGDGECQSVARGECPENFHDITVADTTLVPRENGLCTNGYGAYTLTANCAGGATQNNMCAVLCDAGTEYTNVGTCAARCSAVSPTMRASNGMEIPLWATRQTTPAMNIKNANGDVCYINFLSGAERGTINIKSGKTTYHMTD